MAGNIVNLGNGNFRLRVSVGSGPSRKVYSKYVKHDGKIEDGKIPRAIQTELAKFVTEVNNGQVVHQKNITFAEFVEIWKRDYAKNLREKTKARYYGLLERILPALGHIKLQNIKPTHLNMFYSNLAEPGIKMPQIKNEKKRIEVFKRLLKEDPEATMLSKATIHRYHELVSSILSKAVK